MRGGKPWLVGRSVVTAGQDPARAASSGNSAGPPSTIGLMQRARALVALYRLISKSDIGDHNLPAWLVTLILAIEIGLTRLFTRGVARDPTALRRLFSTTCSCAGSLVLLMVPPGGTS